jgi:hypothetical protein
MPVFPNPANGDCLADLLCILLSIADKHAVKYTGYHFRSSWAMLPGPDTTPGWNFP